jgi:DDE superfamily endonuclease
VCLPVLARLWHPREADHTKLVLAHQMIRLVAARYPTRKVHVVADAAYAGRSPLGLPRRVSLTSRLRRDAALHALPPASPASGADPAARATGCPPSSASPTFQPPPGSRSPCAATASGPPSP